MQNLSLARSGGDTVGLSTGRNTLGLAIEGSDLGHQMRIGKGSLAHSSEALSAAGCLAVALVGGEVERDEEEEVRAENANAGEGCELLTRARAGVGHVGEIGRCKVGVRSKVDEACGLVISE